MRCSCVIHESNLIVKSAAHKVFGYLCSSFRNILVIVLLKLNRPVQVQHEENMRTVSEKLIPSSFPTN